MPRPLPTAPLLCFALSLCACGTDTRLQRGVLDAGRDARVDDAASPDGSQAQGDGSAGHDADVAKEPCDAACKGATPHCDIAADACVVCTGDQHCKSDPNNSRCVQGACVPCETNEHCQGITNGSVALGVCDQGACVECTSEHAEACLVDGTQYVCDPQRNICDPKRKARSKTLCNTCIADSDQDCRARPECVSDMECQPGQACVLVAAGNGIAVCQKVADDAPCPRP